MVYSIGFKRYVLKIKLFIAFYSNPFLALDISYPYFPRSSHQWGFFRELSVRAPFLAGSLPEMRIVGDQGDYSFVLMDRFNVVALNKQISIYGGGVYRTAPVSDPHLVSLWGEQKIDS